MTGEPSILLMKCCSVETNAAKDPLSIADKFWRDSASPSDSTEIAKSFNDFTKESMHLNASHAVAPVSQRGISIESRTNAVVTFAAAAADAFESLC